MFERIVLAIDQTPDGEVAVSFATALASGTGAAVHVVHANLLLLGGRGGVTVETPEQAARVVDSAVAQLHESGVEASGQHFPATVLDVGRRIADVADSIGADVVMVGSHRRRGAARIASRGVRERVTRATLLPVIVAPPPLRVGRRRRSTVELHRLARAMTSSDHAS
jgi:nucleotide-binding universal stress UspA family protein